MSSRRLRAAFSTPNPMASRSSCGYSVTWASGELATIYSPFVCIKRSPGHSRSVDPHVRSGDFCSEREVYGRMSSAAPRHHKKDFWIVENQRYSRAHYRLQMASRIVNEIAGTDECDLLDLGCGPATLQKLLAPNIHYHGIDIALSEPAPYLIEADLLESPIEFRDKHFDIVLAHGLFEYIGSHHSQKFSEIAQLLNENGHFVVSYTNFGHRQPEVYRYYASARPLQSFRQSLSEQFAIERSFPTSHNWNHSEPNRRFVMAANLRWNRNVPVVGPKFGGGLFLCLFSDQSLKPRGWMAHPGDRYLGSRRLVGPAWTKSVIPSTVTGDAGTGERVPSNP